jgi:DNA-directed RNA polymerase specialized sigma24 family protein
MTAGGPVPDGPQGRTMPSDHSVTTWIGLLRDGDTDAARLLWQRYFGRLVEFARGKLHGTSRRAADEEDVALSAFHSFCAAAGRFPKLNDRQDLWQVLVMLTARKAFQERRQQQTQKRGGTTGPAGARTAGPTAVELDEIVGAEPTPDFAVLVAEHFHALLTALPDDDLRLIAKLKLEEHTSAEIAGRLQCSERTVERKLALIRGFWEESAGA